MIVALAGRRVDAADAQQQRFPLQNVSIVKTRVRTVFQDHGVSTLVCSAACGADLVALCEAGPLGLRRRVVLPFDRSHFRETSVVDRPGEWGALYDQILDQVEAAGDLIIIPNTPEEEAYSATNRRILDEAVSLAKQFREPAGAVLVWDGASRGNDDITQAFGIEARNRGLSIVEVSTNYAGE